MTLKGFKRRIAFFFINKLFVGVHPKFWNIKRTALNWAGIKVGENTKIVGPIRVSGELEIGDNTWIGAGLTVHGNGSVKIGDNCDLAPDVTFLTGSHKIGNQKRRAGEGISYRIIIQDGTWLGAKSTIMGNINIGSGCVVGACSLLNKSISENSLAVGVPAHVVKQL